MGVAMRGEPGASETLSVRGRRWLLAILVVSVLLRVGVALYYGDWVPARQDDNSYHTLGAQLAKGQGFRFPRSWYPFTPADTPTAHWSFLYSYFVAGVYVLAGVQPLVARLAGAVLGGVLLPLLVYRLARRLFASREGLALLAAGCAAVYGYFVLYGARLMTETFYITALLWALERALALAERPTPGKGAVVGLSLGIAALLRQSILPWAVVLFVWLLWVGWREGRVRRMAAGLALAAAVMVACIAPFTVRNYRVYGEFLLLNSNAGYAMYSAQHPMHGTSFQEFGAAPLPEDLRDAGLNEAQLDGRLMRRGLGFVLAEPGRYLLLSLSRVRDYFEFWPTADTTLLHNVGRVGSFGVFLPVMLVGIWLALRWRGPGRSWAGWAAFSTTPLALVLLFVVFYSLLHILTWAMPRYRLPVDAVLIIFAAYAIDHVVKLFLRKRRRG